MAEFVCLPDAPMVAIRVCEPGSLPPVGKTLRHGDDLIVAIGPDEWLAIEQADSQDGAEALIARGCDALLARGCDALLARCSAFGGIAIDVSGNRVAYRVSGPDARLFLSAGCSLDLEQLGSGDAVATLVARTQAIVVVETATSFLLLPRRSFANYLEAWAAGVGKPSLA